MSKLVVLQLEGDLELQGFQITLKIGLETEHPLIQVTGKLPANLELSAQLESHWQDKYRSLGTPARITSKKIIHKGSINQRIAECKKSAQKLRNLFLNWLDADSFRSIDRRLREKLNHEDSIRWLISTEDSHIHKLPWQEWDVIERYKHSEIAFSATEFEHTSSLQTSTTKTKIKILAILGHSQGIDVEVDRQKLQGLPGADVEFLIEPSRQELNEQLWEQSWDLLFFAGHSETEGETGRIYLNPQDSLSLGELKYGLEKAIARGLKIAIFNSCDGLGLAQELKQLNIPQMIVMREPVPDQVAQIFLQDFLQAFAKGCPFYLAEREAREKLQGLEDKFPCASWLPIIYQNPIEVPPDWQELSGFSRQKEAITSSSQTVIVKQTPRLTKLSYRTVILISLAVAFFVVGIRLLGFLQSQELQAYDHLISLRPPELLDSRILVLEVTEEDTAEYGYPLEDAILVELLQKLLSGKPRAIGLDMHRYQPRGQGRKELVSLFKNNKNLFTVCAYGDPNYVPPPELSEPQLIKNQIGFSNLPQEQNRTVRRHLLSYSPLASTSPASVPCSTPYSLSFQLAYQFLYQRIESIEATDNQEWQFGSVIFPKLPSHFGGYQNLDGQANEVMINYRSGLPGQRVTLKQVLSGNLDPEFIKDRIILVGYTTSVARDDFNTPYGKMSGVWIHAHTTSQIVSTVIDQRPLIWAFPQWVDAFWVLGSSLIVGLLVKILRSTLALALTMGILTVALHQICLNILNQGGWMPLIPSVLGLFLTGISLVIYRFIKSR